MQGFGYPLIAGLVLIVATSLLTYRLQLVAWLFEQMAAGRRYRRVLFALFASFAAHLLSIGLYGVAFGLATSEAAGGYFGELTTAAGEPASSWLICLYFSAASYTSLGYGDIVPLGGLRILAGLEALNGLVLIGWSATFTFLAMREFQPPAGREDAPAGGLE